MLENATVRHAIAYLEAVNCQGSGSEGPSKYQAHEVVIRQ
jgi:hypothetical protein